MSAFHSTIPYLYGIVEGPSPVPSIEEPRVPRAVSQTIHHRPPRAQRRLEQALESGWQTVVVPSRIDTEETLPGVASEILGRARAVMARHGRPVALAQLREAERPHDRSDPAEIWRLVLRAVRAAL